MKIYPKHKLTKEERCILKVIFSLIKRKNNKYFGYNDDSICKNVIESLINKGYLFILEKSENNTYFDKYVIINNKLFKYIL